MTTDFFVKYGLYDTTASQDAKESSETNAVFGNIGLLKSRNCPPDYATLEHNFFALDGSQQTSRFFPAYNPGQMGSLQNSL